MAVSLSHGYSKVEDKKQDEPPIEDATASFEDAEDDDFMPPSMRRRLQMEALERQQQEAPALVRKSSITSVASIDIRDWSEEKGRTLYSFCF